MRCEPGQMAIVIAGSPRENLGRVIRVIDVDSFASSICGLPMWRYEGELVGMLGNRSMAVADDCLRPIRNPGDDEIDEMVRIAGVAPVTLTEVIAGEVSHG